MARSGALDDRDDNASAKETSGEGTLFSRSVGQEDSSQARIEGAAAAMRTDSSGHVHALCLVALHLESGETTHTLVLGPVSVQGIELGTRDPDVSDRSGIVRWVAEINGIMDGRNVMAVRIGRCRLDTAPPSERLRDPPQTSAIGRR